MKKLVTALIVGLFVLGCETSTRVGVEVDASVDVVEASADVVDASADVVDAGSFEASVEMFTPAAPSASVLMSVPPPASASASASASVKVPAPKSSK